MCANNPQAAVWLTVPDNCWMRGEFEAGDNPLPNIHVMLGSNHDDKHLLFERDALERFVELARQLLAVPVSTDSPTPRTLLESSQGLDIREKSPATT